MQPDEPNDKERLEELPQDGQTPFQPADPSRDDSMPADEPGQIDSAKTDDTRPDTDTGIDSTELYNEGINGAAEMEEPNAGNSVVGYTPPASGDDPDKTGSTG